MKLLLATLLAGLALCHCVIDEETAGVEYLRSLNKELLKIANVEMEASWAYTTNITDENERKRNEVSTKHSEFLTNIPRDILQFNWRSYSNNDTRRQFKKLAQTGSSALPIEDYAELMNALSSMESNYVKARVCDFGNRTKCGLSLEPEIEEVISKSRNPEELKYYWTQFYNKAGTPSRSSFEKYIEMKAKDNSSAESWFDAYEDETFEAQVEAIFEDIKPLYTQIFSYVRYRLRQHYGDDVVSENGTLPMHLLGNIWAEKWSSIADIVSPFPNKPMIDVSKEMVAQGYTPLKMFQKADEFFQSMGLLKAPQAFWNKSVLEKPNDGREVNCYPASSDFYVIDDVRILMCTRVTQDQFFTVHHELGHIQYFLQYQTLPLVYRDGANPAFHEAIGDVLALSVSTPKHLQRVGLLKNYVRDDEARINKLFLTALDKIVYLPVAISMDKYRWALFRGQVNKSELNCAFWKLREEFSGIEPPVVRTENDFDPPAQFFISAGVDYLRYLVAYILQFQLHKSACTQAGQYDPSNPEMSLDNCDIYGSLEAGEAFRKLMSMGSSKPWPDALEAFSGERTMTGKAIAEYFEPLRVWLEAENKKNKVHIGWIKRDKCVSA